MQVRYEKVGRTGKNRFTGEMREPIDKAYYICQTYNRLGKNACTSHKIEARDLYNLVLKDIQELAEQVMKLTHFLPNLPKVSSPFSPR